MPITHPYRDIPMKMKQEMKRYARKVKGKLTTVFDPDHLEALARQTDFIQRSSSKLSGKDFVELMTTEMIEDPAVSLEGLCDVLVDLNSQSPLEHLLQIGHRVGVEALLQSSRGHLCLLMEIDYVVTETF